jgi:hypothetical protein
MVDIQILLEVDFPTGVFFVGLIVQIIVTRVDRRAVVVNLRVLPLLVSFSLVLNPQQYAIEERMMNAVLVDWSQD